MLADVSANRLGLGAIQKNQPDPMTQTQAELQETTVYDTGPNPPTGNILLSLFIFLMLLLLFSCRCIQLWLCFNLQQMRDSAKKHTVSPKQSTLQLFTLSWVTLMLTLMLIT